MIIGFIEVLSCLIRVAIYLLFCGQVGNQCAFQRLLSEDILVTRFIEGYGWSHASMQGTGEITGTQYLRYLARSR